MISTDYIKCSNSVAVVKIFFIIFVLIQSVQKKNIQPCFVAHEYGPPSERFVSLDQFILFSVTRGHTTPHVHTSTFYVFSQVFVVKEIVREINTLLSICSLIVLQGSIVLSY